MSCHPQVSTCSIGFLFCLLWSLLFLKCAGNCQESDSSHTILIDSKHAHNFISRGIEKGNFDYHSLFGLKDALEHLKEHDFRVIEFKDGILNHTDLNQSDTLLINLVSDNLPPFLIEEIYSIKNFVEKGGNLLVITDHSNCYHHSYKLAPLFSELGISLFNESALEQLPRTLGPGPGWIIIDHFNKHAITRNLSCISFHTGGTVDSEGAVATLSEKGWGDLWLSKPYGENALDDGNRGNYGNFKRDQNERTGKLGVVLARTYGAGKIVVVGDQNIFGNLWIRYADNYKFVFNIFSWFSGNSEILRYRSFINSQKPPILLLEEYANTFFADYGKRGYYNAYAELSREFAVFTSNNISEGFKIIVLAPVPPDLQEDHVMILGEHLRLGADIVFLRKEGKLDSRSQSIFTRITDGLEQESREEAPGRTVIEYKSAGRVVFINNIERFDNSKIQEPYEKPDEKQNMASDTWMNFFRSLAE